VRIRHLCIMFNIPMNHKSTLLLAKTRVSSLAAFFICLLFALPSMGQVLPSLPTEVSPLLIGEKIPAAKLRDTDAKEVVLTDLITDKQTVLIFYRGGWCPYCNLHLKDLQSIESDVIKAGYQIIAISPDTPKKLKESMDKSGLRYKLVNDSQTDAIRQFGIAYKAPEQYGNVLSSASDNQNPDVLPVPSVFVLNRQGEIIFEYINPDFKKRVPSDLLLSALKALKD
jgi:peroxiredoxin